MKDLARSLCLFGCIDSFLELPECSSERIGIVQDTGLHGLSPHESLRYMASPCCVLVLS